MVIVLEVRLVEVALLTADADCCCSEADDGDEGTWFGVCEGI